jgi:predicted N-formylglutamate amidohydrolase
MHHQVVDKGHEASIVIVPMNIVPNLENTGLRGPQDVTGFVSHYVMAGDRTRRILLVADHARNALPEVYGTLGLPASEFERHIGYDIGVEAVVAGLAARLNVPAVLSGFSRLLIDPNRGVDDPTLIMQLSDGAIVPGNARVSAHEREFRLNQFHRPYHTAIDAEIDAMIEMDAPPLLVSIHSFTSAWKGVPRPWHAGLLWEDDRRSSDLFIAALAKDHSLVVGDNEPYAGGLEGDCMNMHAVKRGLPHTLLEIRQDLISDEAGVADWVERLAVAIEEMVANDQIRLLHEKRV